MEEVVDVALLDGETGLDGLLAGPVLSVGLALHEDGVGLHASVPSESVGLGTFVLSETAVVEVEVLVVVVDGGDGGVLGLKLLVGVEHEHGQVLEDDELQLGDVVRVDPVLGGLSDEVLLLPAGSGVTLDGSAAGADDVVELGDLHDEAVVVLLEEGLRIQADSEHGLQDEVRVLVVLLDDLLEAGVVEAGELGEVVDISNDVAELLLENLEVKLAGWSVGVEQRDGVLHLLLDLLDTSEHLAVLHLAEGVHLVELDLQGLEKRRLQLLGPLAVGLLQVLLELLLQLIVRDVVVAVLSDQRAAEHLAELHGANVG